MPSADPSLLRHAAELAIAHLERVAERPVGARATVTELRAALDGPLPATGVAPEQVIDELARAADPGLVASPGPRYFGFVTGGALPAALAADWLTSAWDQNGFSAVSSPAAGAVEAVATGWLAELLGLPAGASVGLVTGAQMANVTAFAAARHRVLDDVGWDVAERGLAGAPPVAVLVGAEAHVTVLRALRLLGFGTAAVTVVPADGQGRMRAAELARALAGEGPAIVCAQAGNVNTGACDPLADIVSAARERGAWVHVDGAFGLWAAASPALAPLVAGGEGASSWATDAHKWLNVPYDCGVVAVADPSAHRAAMAMAAAYLTRTEDAGERSNSDWAPEASRRARGFAVYAALRSLGRDGVAALVERCCALARRMAAALEADPALTILNDVVLNQVLVGVDGGDAATDAAVAAVQRDGTCWLGATRWQGRPAMRISVSSWATTEDDVDRSAAAIRAAVGAVAAR